MKSHHFEDKVNKLKLSDKLFKIQIGKTVQIEH